MKYSLIKKVYPDFGETTPDAPPILTESVFEPFDPNPIPTTPMPLTESTTTTNNAHLDAINHVLNCDECKAVIKKTLKMNEDTVFKQNLLELCMYALFIMLIYVLL